MLIDQTFDRDEKHMQDLDSSLSRSHSKADGVQSWTPPELIAITRDGSPRSLMDKIRLRGTTSSLRCILQEFLGFWNAEFLRGERFIPLVRWGWLQSWWRFLEAPPLISWTRNIMWLNNICLIPQFQPVIQISVCSNPEFEKLDRRFSA